MLKNYIQNVDPNEYDSPFARYKLKALQECIPINASIELTMKCNFRCVHCYNFDRGTPLPKEMTSTALTDAEIFNVINHLKEAGTMYLSFTGGDPLLHPSLNKFIKHARSRHMAIKIKTNGSLLSKEKANHLFQIGVRDIDISLYGSNAEEHSALTRSPETFQKTLNGIQNALDVGMSVAVNYIIHNKNYLGFGNAKDMITKMGAHFSSSIEMTTRYDDTKDSLSTRITPQQFEELIHSPGGESLRASESPTNNIQCPCARTNCGISYKGDVYPCIGAPIYAGNIRKQSFEEIWEKSDVLNAIRNYDEKDYEKCQDCQVRKFCPRSGGSTYLNTGDFTGADPWDCEVAEILSQNTTRV